MGAIAVAGRLTDADLAAVDALDLAAVGARYYGHGMTQIFEARMPGATK